MLRFLKDAANIVTLVLYETGLFPHSPMFWIPRQVA